MERSSQPAGAPFSAEGGGNWEFSSHLERKIPNGQRLLSPREWPAARAEIWHFTPGVQAGVVHDSHEIAILLSGRTVVKRAGDGRRQEGLARVGSAWICPAGTFESHVEATGESAEWLFLFLPPELIGQSVLAEHGIDPEKVRLAYAGGNVDPILVQIGACFRQLLAREEQPTDRLFVDGLRTALAAHLIGNYSVDQWRPLSRSPVLDMRRLGNVLEYIEDHLSDALTLAELAGVACLSPFHFARSFRMVMGVTPHRFVIERRVEVAKQKLALGYDTLFEIALDNGFGSQANFTRVFRKITGFTPGEFRAAHKVRSVSAAAAQVLQRGQQAL